MGTRRGRVDGTVGADCYLCCLPIVEGTGSIEHVVPQCFYEGRAVPKDGPMLPAHRACNGSTSADEQMIFVALGQTAPSRTHTPELQARSNRSLKGDSRLAREFMSRVFDDEDATRWVSPEQECITRVIAKIVKGILYQEARILLGPDWRWTARQVEPIPFPPDKPRWLVGIPANGGVRGKTVAARGFRADAALFVWHLLLNGAHQVLVFVSHEDVPLGQSKGPRDFLQLEWPLKRIVRAQSTTERGRRPP